MLGKSVPRLVVPVRSGSVCLEKETLFPSCMGTAPRRVCCGCRWFFQVAPCFAGSISVLSLCLGVRSPKSPSILSSSYVVSYVGSGASKGNGATKAVGGTETRTISCSSSLGSCPPAVAKPKVDGAIGLAGKTKFVAKGKTLGGVAVALVLLVAYRLASGPPVLCLTNSSRCSTSPRSCASNRNQTSTRFHAVCSPLT